MYFTIGVSWLFSWPSDFYLQHIATAFFHQLIHLYATLYGLFSGRNFRSSSALRFLSRSVPIQICTRCIGLFFLPSFIHLAFVFICFKTLKRVTKRVIDYPIFPTLFSWNQILIKFFFFIKDVLLPFLYNHSSRYFLNWLVNSTDKIV